MILHSSLDAAGGNWYAMRRGLWDKGQTADSRLR